MRHSEIDSVIQLANYLRCTEEFINRAINNEFVILEGSDALGRIYNSDDLIVQKINIKKKGRIGGFRVVYSTNTFQLSNILKTLNNYLSEIYLPDISVHGYVTGKSIRTNAEIHLAKRIILSVDIKNFFESISKEMVSEALQGIGFTKNASDWISNITTINNHLVQGFNTSPTLANIVVDQMDKELTLSCGDAITYTRYADDLYFSSENIIPNLNQIESIISKYSFSLNVRKTKFMKRGRNQYVTGLTVFDNNLPRIPKRVKRNLRLEIHCIKKFGYTKHAIRRIKKSKQPVSKAEIEQEIYQTANRIFGWIHFINSIEPELGNRMFKNLIGASR